MMAARLWALLRAVPGALWAFLVAVVGVAALIFGARRSGRQEGAAGEAAKSARVRANWLAQRVKEARARGDDAEVQRLAQEQVKQGRRK